MSARSVLVSGASVAGPVLAYWLHRYGFDVTVVERTPQLRAGLGGHAVDLFGPAVDIAEWTGVLPQVLAARTRTTQLRFERPGRAPMDVDFTALAAGISARHVEIMRGELATILHEATRDTVDYRFGDSVTAIRDDADGARVRFANAPPQRFDLVVGADGLHSNVRRLVFGDEAAFRRYIGGYFAVFTVPGDLVPAGRMRIHTIPGKVAAIYPVWQTGQARAGLLFRSAAELHHDHHDVAAQRALLRRMYADVGWEVPWLLDALKHAPDLYLDSISQIRMDTWSRGRVTLVGDAGYSPGPAVGGGTTLAVVGAYVLAGALADADGDHVAGFARYEDAMREFVRRSRTIGPSSMRALIPATPAQVWLAAQFMRIVPRLPGGVQRRLGSLQGGPARALESITLTRPPTVR